MTKTLEEQGFIKHDGGPMPECYAPDDLVDNVLESGRWTFYHADGFYWDDVTHHRRHISTEAQLAMAVEALERCQAREYNPFEADNQSALYNRTEETLTLIKQRNPEL